MKKIFFTGLILSLFFLTGCGKYTEKSIVKDLNKKINQVTGYHIEGNMEIYNGEDVYKYDIASSYENDCYRVSLINKANNHEQIILRNSDGVYVLTPSLNKSFKFQSNWPENSSQVYILQSLQNDINEDSNITLEEKDGTYILNTKISHTNNKNLVSQKIYLDKKLNFTKVEVFDESGNIQIKMVFDSTDLKATFNNKYFSTSENMKTSLTTSESKNSTTKNSTSGNSTTENPTSNSSTTESENRTQNNNSESSSTDKETSILEESIYPMYLPSGTYLSDEETVSKEDGDRIILTFAGESPFILVEESVNASQEMEIIPVYGEPTILMDTVGALSESSVNFISNGVEYYIASESLTMQEIIQVAESISTLPVMK
ncbi:MAG: hypothetical protein J6B64_04005 [Bacilli bacterium]|nr:hypothetical protein [Bacilli bacterium]MBP3635456.1 hypothetical protein [Bacilli bacterium]